VLENARRTLYRILAEETPAPGTGAVPDPEETSAAGEPSASGEAPGPVDPS
jgi:hypothetical protein